MAAGGGFHQIHRRLGTQRAADPIEVTGDQVDQLHQPLAERAEGLGRDAHPPVANRLVRRREIPRQLADLLSRNPTTGAHRFGAEGGDRRAHLLDAVQRELAGARQAFLEQSIEQAKQERRVLSRPHEHMLIGDRCGLAATRVDHHQLAAAGADRLQPLLHVRYGHDAAVGGQRVAAED